MPDAAPAARGVYQPRRPQASPLFRLVSDHLQRLQTAYDERFAREYGPWRPVVAQVAGKFLACGVLDHGFARMRCDACAYEYLLAFSCKCRYFCPSCHAKRLVIWTTWLDSTLLAPVPHRQVVLTIPTADPLEFLARVLVHIPDTGHVTTRYYGWYANRPRGTREKAAPATADGPPTIVPAPRLAPTEASRRWAALLKQIFEVDPLACPSCHDAMRIVAFITQTSVIDQILTHLTPQQPVQAAIAPPWPQDRQGVQSLP